MAKPTIELINALRETARRLSTGAHYAWGHHGACTCGNLVQVVTTLSEGEILRFAHSGTGEWTEMAREFCSITNAPLTLVFNKLEAIGLTPTDIHNVEYLADKAVLRRLEGGFRWLRRNKRQDAIAYFEAFANLLEDKLLPMIDLTSLELNSNAVVRQPVMQDLQVYEVY